ncbi:hypothetical protein J437_LFUL011791 [Ladona fulva]|uniref:Major facilitator superfamily (MFS) profile domain-containing protein n=1 Tax=Ladona fulva TaxID=123851 RepID=A0A8K0KDB1_LADFU|nr:hypothetical protein J437_LFUL011791 [Ladona fulva]
MDSRNSAKESEGQTSGRVFDVTTRAELWTRLQGEIRRMGNNTGGILIHEEPGIYSIKSHGFVIGCVAKKIWIPEDGTARRMFINNIHFNYIPSIGTGILWPSNALALNTYFKARRGVATGFSWTATGLSPVIMPQLISFLLLYTDVHGTVLILAGVALHTLPAALLLQPVHWHGKWVRAEDPKAVELEKDEQQTFLEVEHCEDPPRCRRASLRRGQVVGEEEDGEYIVDTQSTLGLDVTAPISRHSSRWSLGSVGCPRPHRCEDCGTICEEEEPAISVKKADVLEKKVEAEMPIPKISVFRRVLSSIVDFFDLTILKDPKFVSIFVGLTLAFTAEVNFAVLVPFVYAEFGYEKSEVAHFLSILAVVDLVTRFTVPFFTDKVKIDPRISYTVGLSILATGRIILAHAEDLTTILAATIWLGFGKGLRTVYMGLVIPSYVPLRRLPTASGLQMLANGVLFITVGPVFGYLRDYSDDYSASLHCINILTFTAVGLWTTELLVYYCRRRLSKKHSTINVENAPSEKNVKDKN